MPTTQDGPLLEALLDSWDRNHTILINLLRAIPDGGMEARAVDGSPTVAQLFMPGPEGRPHLWAAASLLLAHNAPALHRSARLAAAANLGSPDGHLIPCRALSHEA